MIELTERADSMKELEKIRGIDNESAAKLYDSGYTKAEDVATAAPSDLAHDLGTSKQDAKIIGDSAHDVSDDVHEAVEKAWNTLLNETMRQHTLSVQTVNSAMQRIGILLAFAPLLFIEAIKAIPDGATGTAFAPTICLGLCFLLGVTAVLAWKISLPSFGADINKLVDLYDNDKWAEMQDYVLSSAMEGYDEIRNCIDKLRTIMAAMVIALLFGTATLMLAMLGKWEYVDIFSYLGVLVLILFIISSIKKYQKPKQAIHKVGEGGS